MVELSETRMDKLITPKDYAELQAPDTVYHFNWMAKEAGIELLKTKRILDIGAGTGDVTSIIAKMAPNAEVIVGIDLAPDFIEYAKETQTDKRIQYVVQDATAPFPDDWKFDVIISHLSLVRIANHDAVLQNIDKCLIPGGKVFISHFNLVSGPQADAYFTTNTSPKWRKYIPDNYFDKNSNAANPIWNKIDTYSKFVEKFGFQVLDTKERDIMRFRGTREVAIRLHPNNIAQYYIPEDLRKQYWDDVFNFYPNNVGKDEVSIVHRVSFIYFEKPLA